jgi:acyl CoA:acetate/3-ketoacid CoA transferase alpha subunit
MKLKDILTIAESELKDLSTVTNPDFRLEQAVYVKERKIWEIVASYLVENTNKPSKVFAALAPEFQFLRIYKKLELNENNEMVGFFIHDNKG